MIEPIALLSDEEICFEKYRNKKFREDSKDPALSLENLIFRLEPEDFKKTYHESKINIIPSKFIDSNSNYFSLNNSIFNEKTKSKRFEKLYHIIGGEYSNEIINNDFQLEELLEKNRIHNYLHTYHIQEFTNRLKTPRKTAYFRDAARLILGHKANKTDIERLAEELKDFQDGGIDPVFARDYLPRFLKEGQLVQTPNLLEKIFTRSLRSRLKPLLFSGQMQESNVGLDISRYSLQRDVQSEGSHYGINFPKKYFDTPFNFCLLYDDKLIATVGFSPDEGRIYIEQIQGIKGQHDKLHPIKWERALVTYVYNWAHRYSINEVAIISVENNRWANRDFHLDRERGKMLYDVTAKRCGFKRAEDGDYVKRSNTLKEKELIFA